MLVMAKERRTSHERIDEGGFRGVVVPAPRGVLVVIGRDGNIDAVARTVLDALEYS